MLLHCCALLLYLIVFPSIFIIFIIFFKNSRVFLRDLFPLWPGLLLIHVFLGVCGLKVFSNAFYFLFYSRRDDSPSARLPPLYLNTSSPAAHLSSLSLSSSLLYLTRLLLLSLCPHFSLRLLARTCVHHRHILATCYLITRARATLKTSLAEQTRVEQ